jgi:hypothetical protein
METDAENRAPVFEDIFELIGHFGCVQLFMYIFACVIESCVSLSVTFFMLEYANPGWTCAQVLNASDISIAQNGTGNNLERWISGNVSENACPFPESPCINLTYSDEFTSISTEVSAIPFPYISPESSELRY